jgi:AraC-like DNA-binding protein
MPMCFDQLLIAAPSARAKSLWWHVLSVGTGWRDEPEHHAPRDKAGLFLCWVVSGNGSLCIGKEQFQLRSGSHCWLVDMSKSRSYIPDQCEKLVTAGIRFSGPMMESWRDILVPGEYSISSKAEMSSIQSIQQSVVKTLTVRPKNYEWELHESITQLIGKVVLRSAPNTITMPTADEVNRVIDAVTKEPAKSWRASELADIAGISYSGLRNLFRRQQQETLKDFLTRVRLDQARILLADSRLQIKSVAHKLQFESEYYFSRWFRQHEGKSPTDFRRELRLENVSLE